MFLQIHTQMPHIQTPTKKKLMQLQEIEIQHNHLHVKATKENFLMSAIQECMALIGEINNLQSCTLDYMGFKTKIYAHSDIQKIIHQYWEWYDAQQNFQGKLKYFFNHLKKRLSEQGKPLAY